MDLGIFVRTVSEAHGADDAELFNVEQGEAFASFLVELGYKHVSFQTCAFNAQGYKRVNEQHLWSFAEAAKAAGLGVHLWAEVGSRTVEAGVVRLRECLEHLEGVETVQLVLRTSSTPWNVMLDRSLSYLQEDAREYGCTVGVGHVADIGEANMRAFMRYADYTMPMFVAEKREEVGQWMLQYDRWGSPPSEMVLPINYKRQGSYDYAKTLNACNLGKTNERMWVWSCREAVLPLLNQAPRDAFSLSKEIQAGLFRLQRV